jgi:hypothetical protein
MLGEREWAENRILGRARPARGDGQLVEKYFQPGHGRGEEYGNFVRAAGLSSNISSGGAEGIGYPGMEVGIHDAAHDGYYIGRAEGCAVRETHIPPKQEINALPLIADRPGRG